MLKIWGRKTSSNVQAVMWCVGELGLAYERIDAGLDFGVVDTPEYLAINPNGTVPVLKDGDNPPLWESGAILRYLAAVYAAQAGQEAFWPGDPVLRADVDRWAEWSKVNIASNFTTFIFWRVVRTPPSKRDPAAIAQALAVLDRFLAIAETRLGRHPYLGGDRFTLADIQFGHCLFRYYDIEIERAQRPSLRRYYDRLTDRPAFREHVMVSYEALREKD